MKKTALVAGSSGLVGGLLTQSLIKSEAYDKIILLVRRENLKFQHPKVVQHLVDFDILLLDNLVAEDIFCCLGTTMKNAGSKEEFNKVDNIYPFLLAEESFRMGAKQFHLVSAMGADKTSSIFYNKVKGEVEEKIKNLNFESIFIYRPSILLGNREEFRLGEKIGIAIAKAFSLVIPQKYKAIEPQKIANAMIQNANSPIIGIHVLESEILQDF